MSTTERAKRYNEDAYVIAAADPTLVHDLVAEVEQLRYDLYVAMSTSHNLGGALADIAEMIGMDRESEDLAIVPRVRQFVNETNELRGRSDQ